MRLLSCSPDDLLLSLDRLNQHRLQLLAMVKDWLEFVRERQVGVQDLLERLENFFVFNGLEKRAHFIH